jgi:sn-glycerol 3-phosphate transport system permease protein
MIPLEVTFITNLDTMSSLGWFNTYEGLAVPFLATGFGIFLLRQAFLQIPKDLQEAAQLDGYGHWRFMTQGGRAPGPPLPGRPGSVLLPRRLEPVPVAPRVHRRHHPLNTVQIGLKQLVGTQVSTTSPSLWPGRSSRSCRSSSCS